MKATLTTSRRGKLARLPKAVREELNRRLDEGEGGAQLLVWLNGLPEVQAVLATEFGGQPIGPQNLSRWRTGGYREWQASQAALVVAGRLGEDAAGLPAGERPALTDTLALWLAARYAVATRQMPDTDAAEGWRRLRELCADVVELRRGDHSGARLRMEQERQEREREKTEEEVMAQFQLWAQTPAVRDLVCAAWLSPEERQRRLREVFGRSPEPPASGGNPPESNPVKPSQTEECQLE